MLKWKVESCILTNYVTVVSAIETDIWSEVEEFVADSLENGYSVRLTDNETGDYKWGYPEQ
jgi:hypothetical protein